MNVPTSSARVENIHEMFGRTAFPIQLPIGSEKNFSGIVDLLAMKAYSYTPDGDGKGKEIPDPGRHGGRC